MMCASRYIYDTPIPVTKESIVIIHNYIYIYSNSKCTCTYILLQTKKNSFKKIANSLHFSIISFGTVSLDVTMITYT